MVLGRSNRKLRVGIIGLGFISDAHLQGYQKTGKADIVAFCDIAAGRATAARDSYGATNAAVYEDYKEMLEQADLDAVSVCRENSVHAAISIDALNAGVHVFCEKPMAISSADADAMVAAAQKNRRKLTVGYQLRFMENAQLLHDLVVGGQLGKVYYAEARAMRRRGVPTWGNFLKKDKQGGGALIDIGTHLVDQTLWMMNEYSPIVSAVGSLSRQMIQCAGCNAFGPWDVDGFEVEDGAFGMVTFQSGASLLVNATWAANIHEEEKNESVLLGSKAGAVWMPNSLSVNGEFHDRLWQSSPCLPKDNSNLSLYDKEIAHWVDCLLNDTDPKVMPQEAAQVVKVLEAVYQSGENGGRAIILS